MMRLLLPTLLSPSIRILTRLDSPDEELCCAPVLLGGGCRPLLLLLLHCLGVSGLDGLFHALCTPHRAINSVGTAEPLPAPTVPVHRKTQGPPLLSLPRQDSFAANLANHLFQLASMGLHQQKRTRWCHISQQRLINIQASANSSRGVAL